MYHFTEKILGNPEADTIDVYEALEMFLPGMFAYRSILNVKPVPAITEVPPSIRESGNNTRPVLKVQHFFLK